jgi:hypothetical protein
MDQDLSVTHLKQSDDTVLQPGGEVRHVVRVRYMLGRHGPFELVYDRGVDVATISADIANKRRELEQLARL